MGGGQDGSGKPLTDGRRIDLLSGNTAYEVKSGAQALDNKGDLAQLNDYMRLARNRASVPNGNQNSTINSVQYVFTDPKGVKANAEWMETQLSLPGNERLSFKVFNNSGESMTINKSNYEQKIQDLNTWLNQ